MALALYRRYRPDTFEGVIGQDHVTKPLSRALDEGKLTHAYLFSGPRGCGKTSSARILARCINCVEGPTSHPCGKCESCKDLATNGPGSIDVVEIDAASHGSVDDARELRERAGFAPARDRFKIFILDEAHMVTSNGFNALLKIVEEPPEHVMFIFATTEPDKVIGTIRSRTHHYPFRLVPPEVMQPYLEDICEHEGIKVEQGVLKLAMRAGGGSMRDTLSVLDQLMVGSVDGTITYADSVALLGFTPDDLISEAVDAVIESDGPALYSVIEKVVVGGYDPRKFVEDLLAYVRDLLVLTIAGDNATSALGLGQSEQIMDDMRRQASAFTLGDLNIIAERINSALSSMVGTISPRMRLELLAASLLMPTSQGDMPVNGNVRDAESSLQAGQSRMQKSGMTQAAPQTSGWAKVRAQVEEAKQSQPQTSDPVVKQNRPGTDSATQDKAADVVPDTSATSAPMANDANAQNQATMSKPDQIPQEPATQPLDPAQAERMWNSVIATLPSDIKSTVTQEHIPHVELSEFKGNPYMVLTFANPLSQHAFGLAVSSEPVDGHTALQQILNAKLTHAYGTQVRVAPARTTADGQTVTPLRNMSPREQARIKAQIAQIAAKSALAGLTSASQISAPAPKAQSSNDEASSASHAEQGQSHTPDDSESDQAHAEPVKNNSQSASTYDPWADEEQNSSSAQQEVAAQNSETVPALQQTAHEETSEGARLVASPSTVDGPATSNPAEGSLDNRTSLDEQAYDPWADQSTDHAYGEMDGAVTIQSEPTSPSSHGSLSSPSSHESSSSLDLSTSRNRDSQFSQSQEAESPAVNAQGAGAHISHPRDSRGEYEGNDDFAANESTTPEDKDQHLSPQVAPEDDTYSINDADIESSQSMSMDELQKLFNVKNVEEFSADDVRNPAHTNE